MPFKKGDIVTLKTKSPEMTISKTPNEIGTGKNVYQVVWFAGSRNNSALFPEEVLILVSDNEDKDKKDK